MERFVYADNSATTFLSERVLNDMLPFLKERYGNPSSIYSIGRDAKKAVEIARETVAECIGARPEEIFFTSGGSEADNWAVRGAAYKGKKNGKNHIITSSIEHHAVINTVESLEDEGFKVTYIKVNDKGLIDPEDIENAITDKTSLVTIMYANNEIGTIQPISEIGEICHKRGVLFHTDAVQAVGNIQIDVANQNIDLLSISAHKFHGPKGVGALYIRKGIRLGQIIYGGGQESGLRAGTENVAGIVGMSSAMRIACSDIPEKSMRISKMRDRIISELLKVKHSRLNGDPLKRLPGNINICFEGIEGESIILSLDREGICVSSGSACTSGSLDPSHVLLAIGLPHEIAHGSLRLSLSNQNTDEDVDYIIKKVPPIIERLREMSPMWEKILKQENDFEKSGKEK